MEDLSKESNDSGTSKLSKEARTFMPEILAPGTGLSPLTNKSIIPTNNITK